MAKQPEYLGGLEEVVLLAVQYLGAGAYGVAIHEALSDVGRHISIGSLYVTLGRLEEKGFVRSRQGEPTAERGGRAKRFFALTGAGSQILVETQALRQRFRPKEAGGWV